MRKEDREEETGILPRDDRIAREITSPADSRETWPDVDLSYDASAS